MLIMIGRCLGLHTDTGRDTRTRLSSYIYICIYARRRCIPCILLRSLIAVLPLFLPASLPLSLRVRRPFFLTGANKRARTHGLYSDDPRTRRDVSGREFLHASCRAGQPLLFRHVPRSASISLSLSLSLYLGDEPLI